MHGSEGDGVCMNDCTKDAVCAICVCVLIRKMMYACVVVREVTYR